MKRQVHEVQGFYASVAVTASDCLDTRFLHDRFLPVTRNAVALSLVVRTN